MPWSGTIHSYPVACRCSFHDAGSRKLRSVGIGTARSTRYRDLPNEYSRIIACHRLGWPETESHNQYLNLPSMQEGDKIFLEDANDTVYEYRVVETLTIEPDDTWVTVPVAGEDMVSLQTCLEALDDLLTPGPDWAARFVVRAKRVEERQQEASGGS